MEVDMTAYVAAIRMVRLMDSAEVIQQEIDSYERMGMIDHRLIKVRNEIEIEIDSLADKLCDIMIK
jgi:hypothetical protein